MILALWRRRLEGRKFEDSSVYIARLKAVFEFSVYDKWPSLRPAVGSTSSLDHGAKSKSLTS